MFFTNKKVLTGILVMFVLLLIPATNLNAATKKNQFVKKKGYTYYYDENGKKIKDTIYEVKGGSYYFDKNGVMIKGWVKKGKKYYYFDRKTGKMKKNCKVDDIKLKKDGTAKTDKDSKKKIETMITARKVVAKITKPTDKQSVKIKACCKYIMDMPYARPPRFLKSVEKNKGWECDYANDMFKYGKGDCISESCALGFLMKELGMKNVYVCYDSKDSHAHAWTEVNGKVYDTLFAEAKKDHGYLGVTYKEYSYNGITKAPYKRKI